MAPILLFSVLNTKLSFRAHLLPDKNPDTVDLISRYLPITTFLTNTVVAGETLQMGTKIVALSRSHMVERAVGGVYFYAPGSQINVCYGRITETAKVNQFAQVPPEDLDQLRLLGDLVREQTMATADRTLVRVSIDLLGNEPAIIAQPKVDLPTEADLCRIVEMELDEAIDKNWYEEPDEIRLIRLCISSSGAGTGGSSFPLFVHHKAYLMIDGGGLLFRFLKLATREDVSLYVLLAFTRGVFFETFDHFVFFGDIGLTTLASLGLRYKSALETLQTKGQFIELSKSFLLLINVFHRWINLVFPWHLGVEFPHRSLADVTAAQKLVTYREPQDSVSSTKSD